MRLWLNSERERVTMSYSRWGASRWYTYWACQDKETENRETAIFQVCPAASFTAAELRRNLDMCVSTVINSEPIGTHGHVTDAERDELAGYMYEFLADVKEAYPPRTTHSPAVAADF